MDLPFFPSSISPPSPWLGNSQWFTKELWFLQSKMKNDISIFFMSHQLSHYLSSFLKFKTVKCFQLLFLCTSSSRHLLNPPQLAIYLHKLLERTLAIILIMSMKTLLLSFFFLNPSHNTLNPLATFVWYVIKIYPKFYLLFFLLLLSSFFQPPMVVSGSLQSSSSWFCCLWPTAWFCFVFLQNLLI